VATGATELVDQTIANGVFSPDLWSKMVLRATESRLVLAKLVDRKYEADASIGKTVKVASVGNLSARAKAENTLITYETVAETATTITLNLWSYAAFGVEAIVKTQANIDVQNEYQRKAGYAIAKDVDTKLAAALPSGATQIAGTLGTVFTDDDVRRGVQYLDDADAPEEGRVIVMSPKEKADKLALDKWTNTLYRGTGSSNGGGTQVNNGQIGDDIYGLTPYVTTNLNKPAGGQADNTIFQKEGYALVQQVEPRTHIFYDIDLFANKIAIETIFGHAEMRDAFLVWLRGAA
jgi:hypothetical protein